MINYNPKISVCIPTYESNGKGVKFLSKNLDSILNQTYNNIEIIISDHSQNDDIEIFVKSLNLDNILYLRNRDNIGFPSYNTNNAIKNSKGDYIKLMNLDDYIEGNDTIQMMVDLLSKGSKWVLCGCKHLNYDSDSWSNPIIPRIEGDGKHLLNGVNYIGCPSVALIPKNEYFDTEVIYMIDCELWYRMYIKYGYPGILEDYRIVIGIGNHTLTNQLLDKQYEWIEKDKNYCSIKYNQ
jgi:glycosyltransferase involved in cell wall biosynthesis